MAKTDTITVTVLSPQEIVWQGEALSLSSVNSEGPFDVLPDHARFMTIIEDHPIVVSLSKKEEKSFTFKNAVLFFKDNSAKVYTHHSSAKEEKK